MSTSAVKKTAGNCRGLQILAQSFLVCFFGVLTVNSSIAAESQELSGSASAPAARPAQQKPASSSAQSKMPTSRDRRRAAKFYLAAGKLFVQQKYPAAIRAYEAAAKLDPTNTDYALAATVARSHQVTALLQVAVKDRIQGDAAAARASLQQALALDPNNPQIAQHLYELGQDATADQVKPLYESGVDDLAAPDELAPTPGTHSFHLHVAQHQLIEQVFKAYGIQATVDESVRYALVRMDMDDASFADAKRVLALLTGAFFVPLDAHHVLAAQDTSDNRQKYERQELETVYLTGLTSVEMTDVSNLAKNVFNLPQVGLSPSAGTLTVRAPASNLKAFNATLQQLMDGRSQVLLDIKIYQLAHTSDRNTGAQVPTSITAFNLYTEEQQILNQNQALIQQLVSSGLVSPNNVIEILGALLAAGAIPSSLFSNGIATFGNGKTASGITLGSITENISLNSSDTRALEDVQLRLGDGEDGTLRLGERYPIQTSSFSSLASSSSALAGLSGAGNSSQLSSLLSSLSSAAASTIPQVQYEDLGLTLKATPRVLRGGLVAITLDLKIDSLAGSSINGVPVLNNTAFSGVVTLDRNQGVVVLSELSKQESRAISGVPGISEIPGMNDLTDKDVSKNYSKLLIVLTPHVIRGSQAAGHSPMLRIEKGITAH